MRFFYALLLSVCLFSVITPTDLGKVDAASITIYAEVQDTSFVLNGYFASNALITFIEENITIGTTTTDSNGFFSKEFTAVDPGIHHVTIIGSDLKGSTTVGIIEDIALLPKQRFEANNILLPPTIKIDQSATGNINDITISGFSKPNSIVELDLQGKSGSLILVDTKNDGYYEHKLSSSSLIPGDYKITARLKFSVALYSVSSQELTFRVFQEEKNIVVVPPVVTNKDKDPCLMLFNYPRLCFFDNDESGDLNIFNELKLIVFGFIKYLDQKVDNAFDINEDGIVSGADLSIALYYVSDIPYEVLGVSNDRMNEGANFARQNGRVFGINLGDEESLVDVLFNVIYVQTIFGVILFVLFIILFVATKFNARDKLSKPASRTNSTTRSD